MAEFKLVAPLDAQGLDFSRPRDQRLWSALTNVWFNDGRLETRPGLRPVGPPSQDVSLRSGGIITAIGENRNWASETTSIGTQQRRVPTSTTFNSGWTITGAATVHEAIDDTVPDEYTTNVFASTSLSAFTVGFADLAGAPDFVDDVVLHVRAVANLPLRQQLHFNLGPTVGSGIGIVELSNTDYDSAEGTNDGFMDFYLPFRLTDMTPGQFDAAQVTVTLVKDALPAVVVALANTTGMDDDFTPSGSDAWKGTNENEPTAFSADVESFVTGSVGDRLSIVFEGPQTPVISINAVNVQMSLSKFAADALGGVTIYHVGTDSVRRAVGVALITRQHNAAPWDPFHGWQLVSTPVSTNPQTGAAWTVAEVEAGLQFGIEVAANSVNVALSYASLQVEGTMAGGGATITQLELLPVVRTVIGTPTPQQFLGRLMGTTTSFFRFDRQSPGSGVDFVDVLGAASAPTAGWSQWSIAEFFNRLYIENSVDTTYEFIGSAGTMSQLTAPLPIGHTMWSFANRLFKGDVTDGGVRFPKRITWSALAAPNDWTGASSGDLDLTHGGEGRVRKGLSLGATTSAVYLDKGIYTVRWTGDDSAPFIPKLADADTGIVAPLTCRPILDKDGEAVHLFLGRGPQGISVYAFDGVAAQDVGGEVSDEITRLANHNDIEYAFAWVEPRANLYLLFVPEGTQTMPQQAWVFHVDTGHWTRWEFPFGISAVGEWTILLDEGAQSQRDGEKTLVLGTTLGVPFYFNFDAASDWVNAPGSSIEGNASTFFTSAEDLNSPSAPREMPIDIEITLGDLVLSAADIRDLTAPMRLWLTYEDLGFADLQLAVSRDGLAFDSPTNFSIGAGGPTNALLETEWATKETVVDVALPTSGRHQALRITNNQTEATARQRIRLTKMMLEFDTGGDLP